MHCVCSWRLLGSNDSLSASVDVPPWQPRAAMKLQQLTSAHMHKEMDFNGVLVWAGDVNKGVLESSEGGGEVGERGMLSYVSAACSVNSTKVLGKLAWLHL